MSNKEEIVKESKKKETKIKVASTSKPKTTSSSITKPASPSKVVISEKKEIKKRIDVDKIYATGKRKTAVAKV